jgi:serine/threonine protein kinase
MAFSWFDWLRRIAVHVVKAARKPLNSMAWGLPVGDLVYDIAGDLLATLNEDKHGGTPEEALARIAQAPRDRVRAEVIRLVEQLAADQPPKVRQELAAYLMQVPIQIRQALRRPADPSGRTVPGGLAVRQPGDLLPFLPSQLPRFKPGDRPLAGSDWELVELLGLGGFGEVWKARKPRFPLFPPRALKFCLDPAARESLFSHEADILNRLMQHGRHEGIVQLLDINLEGEHPCLSYEYVEGSDLAQLIHQRYRALGGAPPRQAAHIILRLAEIMKFAHQMRPAVVHRDLKPANVLLYKAADGAIGFKIADFGIGGLAANQALTRTARKETTLGQIEADKVRGSFTYLYASPQQRQNQPPDVRDDVYALGVIWYQLLTGDVAVGSPGGLLWRDRLIGKGMARPLVDLLAACLEDQPADRPADAAVLADRLAAHFQADGQGPPEPIPLIDEAAGEQVPMLALSDHRAALTPLLTEEAGEDDSGRRPDFPPPPDAAQRVRKLVTPPAVGLLAAAGVGILVNLVLVFVSRSPALIVLWVLSILASGLGIVAGVQLLRCRGYVLVLVGSLVPILSPTLPLSLAAAIWALVVLNKPEVKSAFHSAAVS